MPRRRPHPLVLAVRRALPRPRPPGAQRYLALLERRLAALSALATGSTTRLPRLPSPRAARALARRFLKRLEGSWDDGDENLVRGYLDRWVLPGEDPLGAAARALSEAASALVRAQARPQTLWFFLWEMESILSDVDLGRPRVR